MKRSYPTKLSPRQARTVMEAAIAEYTRLYPSAKVKTTWVTSSLAEVKITFGAYVVDCIVQVRPGAVDFSAKIPPTIALFVSEKTIDDQIGPVIQQWIARGEKAAGA